MRKFFRFITSRIFIMSAFLVSQVILIVLLAVLLATDKQYGFYYLIVAWLINIPTLIFIVNTKANIEYKLGWSLIVAIIPVGGAIFYALFANKRDTKRQNRKMRPYTTSLRKYTPTTSLFKTLKETDHNAYMHALYIYNKTFSIPYDNTYTKYYPFVQDAWEDILNELKKAKHFIFLEFFIIGKGRFWNSILEVLKEKVREGVEVRVMYDDYGTMSKLDMYYYKKLRKLGINAVLFQRYKWILDVKMNNRDHRKLLIIDGHTSFTGGFNLADEYVNVKQRFGEWKDNVIMLKGEATYGNTLMFLSMWDNYCKVEDDFDKYKYTTYKHECEFPEEPKGFVQPYGDVPHDYESVGSNVYLNLISRAKHSICIVTPYLILDDILVQALANASRSGVDVKIVLPGIPDKKPVYQMTISTAYDLSKYNVRTYFYQKGFTHSKTFLVDNEYAVVGSINFELRSFYLNYENAVFLHDANCIDEIRKDFEDMFEKSTTIPNLKHKKISKFRRFMWGILRCFKSMF